MTVKERILRIRLAESVSRQPEYAQTVGVVTNYIQAKVKIDVRNSSLAKKKGGIKE